jgi:hypothetical protein
MKTGLDEILAGVRLLGPEMHEDPYPGGHQFLRPYHRRAATGGIGVALPGVSIRLGQPGKVRRPSFLGSHALPGGDTLLELGDALCDLPLPEQGDATVTHRRRHLVGEAVLGSKLPQRLCPLSKRLPLLAQHMQGSSKGQSNTQTHRVPEIVGRRDVSAMLFRCTACSG